MIFINYLNKLYKVYEIYNFMWKTLLTKFAEKVVYGLGFGLGMGISFKIISINKFKDNPDQ